MRKKQSIQEFLSESILNLFSIEIQLTNEATGNIFTKRLNDQEVIQILCILNNKENNNEK